MNASWRSVAANSQVLVETLEPRRFLAADLRTEFGSTVGGGPSVAVPGQTIQFDPPVTLHNYGDKDVTQPITIGVRLIPIQQFGQAPPPGYDAPTFIQLGYLTINNDVFAGNFGTRVQTPITLPGSLEPGQAYDIIMRIDPFNVIVENDNTNNDMYFGGFITLTSDRILPLRGTEDAELVRLTAHPDYVAVDVNAGDRAGTFRSADVSGVTLQTFGGNDTVVVSDLFPSLMVDTGDGNDRIVGGDGNETLVGGAGKDQIDGGLGNDRLNGNGGHDKLYGGGGADRLYGYAGNDYLHGASSGDRLEGGAGADILLGQSGNDRFFARDGEIDQVFGGSGTDQGSVDADDILGSINLQLP